jgi:hypothetical protein
MVFINTIKMLLRIEKIAMSLLSFDNLHIRVSVEQKTQAVWQSEA